MLGCISDQNVVILIDGGSTHSFVQDHIVRSLGLSTRPTFPLRVMVGNGNKTECRELCEGITIHVQNQIFTIDFHVLPLCGTNVVLGV